MFFVYLTAFFALCLSSVAAYFAVVGLAATFPGSAVAIYIMGGVVEAAKIAMVLYMHRFWSAKLGVLRYSNLLLIAIAMMLTSMGVFGFLAKANIQFEGEVLQAQQQIDFVDSKITSLEEQLVAINQQKEIYDAGFKSLIDQEFVVGAFRQMNEQREYRSTLDVEETEVRKKILDLKLERTEYELDVNSVRSEIGPVIYLAEILYGDDGEENLKSAVRIFIILLVVLLDPMAVSLLISSQIGYNSLKSVRETKTTTDENNDKGDIPTHDEGVKEEEKPESPYNVAFDPTTQHGWFESETKIVQDEPTNVVHSDHNDVAIKVNQEDKLYGHTTKEKQQRKS